MKTPAVNAAASYVSACRWYACTRVVVIVGFVLLIGAIAALQLYAHGLI